MKKQNVIVLGATGGVGAYTSLYLKEKGYNVIAVGKRKSDNGFFNGQNIKYVSVDITKVEDFEKLPQTNIFGIIQLAGFLPANMLGYNPQVYIDTNITGTLNVLQYAIKVKAKRYVYTTSFSDLSYLWGTDKSIKADSIVKFPINNDHSIYSITKNTGADLVRHFSKKHSFNHYILRFPNIYLYHPNTIYYVNGKKQRKGLFNVIDQAKKSEDIELWGSPTKVRDMVYIKDCIQIIEKCFSSSSKGGVFNVGTGVGISRKEQVNGIIKAFSPKEKPSKIIDRNDMPDSPQYIMDITKTIKELGYTPIYSYLKSLMDMKVEIELNRFEKLWGKKSDYSM